MSGSTAGVVEIDSLSLWYGEQPAFRDLNLSLARGSVTVLVGPSGCGKSSLLRAITRLHEAIPETRAEGTVYLNGIDHRQFAAHELRRRVALIAQQPDPLPFSIRRNLEVVLRVRKEAKRTWPERIRDVLQRVRLWDEVHDRLDQPAEALSGGQQQRLCIARALLHRPEVLLLDEPTASLDPDATEHIEVLIRELAPRRAILLVTHDMAQARRLADQLAFCWPEKGCGRLIECGPAADILQTPQHAQTRAWLAQPDT
ncbi:MAG: ATP-binding cassette domain-containing protein [Candidatus Dadabacteria bacterium]|nr:MAG: ATP-binding cassette domain-containing protein [Candidatus Dadabacteria bacterium]